LGLAKAVRGAAGLHRVNVAHCEGEAGPKVGGDWSRIVTNRSGKK
jgi:hypothetical protein